MVNVFLDSNILFNNPFMDSGFNKKLLEKVAKVKGTVFITNIVYKEVINNYRKLLIKDNDTIKNLNKDLERAHVENRISEINIEEMIKKLKNRLDDLNEENKIKILETDNNLLDSAIDRAIKEIKPCSAGKEEIRDSLIWLTYVRKVESEKLENCFFISNNTKDFFSNDGRALHQDLVNDTNRMKAYKSLSDFFSKECDLFDTINIDILRDNFTFSCHELYSDEIYSEFEELLFNYVSENNKLISKYIFDCNTENTISLEKFNMQDPEISSTEVNLGNKTIDIYGKIEIYIELSMNIYSKTVVTVAIITVNFYCVKEIKIKSDTEEYLLKEGFKEFDFEDVDITKLSDEDIDIYMEEEQYEAEQDGWAEQMEAEQEYFEH